MKIEEEKLKRSVLKLWTHKIPEIISVFI